MKRLYNQVKLFVLKTYRFLSTDIWTLRKEDTKPRNFSFYNIIKAFILAFRNTNGVNTSTQASALTYSTLLSIVPLLAVLFAIAKGFGFHNIFKEQLLTFFEGQEAAIEKSMEYIDNSLNYAHEGIFLGIGVIFLLYSVINILSTIETSFNNIWGIPESRSYYRMFTDYLALIIIAPIILICNAGITFFLSSMDQSLVSTIVITPFLKILPYLLIILLYILLYMYIPNTRVKFSSALLGALFAGVSFQVFQYLYMSGQIWIAKYNAIYGSFAALPLLFLWLQLTWWITLFGVELSFAYQNVHKFDFEYERNNISKRYNDFVRLLLTTLIVKRFTTGEKPLTADELSTELKIPSRLATDNLFFLTKIGLIVAVDTAIEQEQAFIPAIDINVITVAYFFNKINIYGVEDFKASLKKHYPKAWTVTESVFDYERMDQGNILLKDL